MGSVDHLQPGLMKLVFAFVGSNNDSILPVIDVGENGERDDGLLAVYKWEVRVGGQHLAGTANAIRTVDNWIKERADGEPEKGRAGSGNHTLTSVACGMA